MCECFDGTLDLGRTTNRGSGELHGERWRGCFDRLPVLAGMGVRIEDGCSACKSRYQLLEQLQPLATHRGLEIGEPGYVAAGMREACSEACANWVSDLQEHDRNAAGFLPQRRCRRRALAHDDVRHQPAQLFGMGAHPVGITTTPADIN